jgi:hypothetical protein
MSIYSPQLERNCLAEKNLDWIDHGWDSDGLSLKNTGHMLAHGRYFHARREDLDKLQDGCRVVVEEILAARGFAIPRLTSR